MKVKIKVYDRCKYDPKSKKVGELLYEIICFKVEYREDDFDEYLILYLSNGKLLHFIILMLIYLFYNKSADLTA